MGRCINAIFQKLESMDVECVDRFTSWFSHHLSNFDWKWEWNDWVEHILKNEKSVKYIAVTEILSKCMRLSYYDRIKKTIPDQLVPLLGEKAAPAFKFEQGLSTASTFFF